MITFVLNNQSILCNSLFFPNKRVSKLKWAIKLSIVGVGGLPEATVTTLEGEYTKQTVFGRVNLALIDKITALSTV